jgi:dephospho-CoA kinase
MSKLEALYAVSGYPGTGKSTIANYFHDKYNFYIFEGSTTIREEASRRGVELRKREDYESFHISLREELGDAWLTNAAMSINESRVIQSGLRLKSNYYRVKEVGGIVLGLVCPPEVCVQRSDKNNPKNPKTVDDYHEHVAIETSPYDYGSQTAWVVDHADYVLDTSRPLAETFEEIDSIIATHTRGIAL